MFSILMFAALACVACSPEKGESTEVPDWRKYIQEDTTQYYEPVDSSKIDYPERTEAVGAYDMVLLYGGSGHRSPSNWGEGDVRGYVTYKDRDGKYHWLYDGFLLLEFMMTQYNKTLVTGYQHNGEYLHSATKVVWENLADYYFKSYYAIDALEKCVETATRTLGEPPSKRKIFIGIPEPIRYEDSHNQTGGSIYWGELDGKQLDFSVSADRVKACIWFIDRVRANFMAKNYKYVELAGFYWVAEKASNSRDILQPISEYLHEQKYSFCWIPYFNADGYKEWNYLGFDWAYLQPNYFFTESLKPDRLSTACDNAIKAKMGMEVEFDGNALESWGNHMGYRLREYLDYFKDYGAWENCRLAYYQGSWAVNWLRDSKSEADQNLYYYLCDWIVSRPIRDSH